MCKLHSRVTFVTHFELKPHPTTLSELSSFSLLLVSSNSVSESSRVTQPEGYKRKKNEKLAPSISSIIYHFLTPLPVLQMIFSVVKLQPCESSCLEFFEHSGSFIFAIIFTSKFERIWNHFWHFTTNFWLPCKKKRFGTKHVDVRVNFVPGSSSLSQHGGSGSLASFFRDSRRFFVWIWLRKRSRAGRERKFYNFAYSVGTEVVLEKLFEWMHPVDYVDDSRRGCAEVHVLIKNKKLRIKRGWRCSQRLRDDFSLFFLFFNFISRAKCCTWDIRIRRI